MKESDQPPNTRSPWAPQAPVAQWVTSLRQECTVRPSGPQQDSLDRRGSDIIQSHGDGPRRWLKGGADAAEDVALRERVERVGSTQHSIGLVSWPVGVRRQRKIHIDGDEMPMLIKTMRWRYFLPTHDGVSLAGQAHARQPAAIPDTQEERAQGWGRATYLAGQAHARQPAAIPDTQEERAQGSTDCSPCAHTEGATGSFLHAYTYRLIRHTPTAAPLRVLHPRSASSCVRNDRPE